LGLRFRVYEEREEMWLHCDTFGALSKCGIDGTVVGCGLTGRVGGGVFILAMILMVEVGLWKW
jgi:hypothetical protein